MNLQQKHNIIMLLGKGELRLQMELILLIR